MHDACKGWHMVWNAVKFFKINMTTISIVGLGVINDSLCAEMLN